MSNETKWTKGPWHYTEHGCVKGGEFQKYERGEVQQQVALATSRDDGKQEPNGRLMAAAPELAEVVRKLVEDYEAWQRDDISPHEIGDIVDEARDALSKARGETS